MEIASVGLQSSPLLNAGVNRAEGRPVQTTPPDIAGNAARQAEVQPQESTRVSLSNEGRSLLAEEQQRVAAPRPDVQPPAPQQPSVSTPVSGPVQVGNTATPVNAVATAATLPPIQPSSQGASLSNGASDSVVNTGTSNQAQATQATSAANRATQQQAEQTQQLQTVREDNQARNRQDVAPVVVQGGAGTYQGVLSF